MLEMPVIDAKFCLDLFSPYVSSCAFAVGYYFRCYVAKSAMDFDARCNTSKDTISRKNVPFAVK